MKVNEIKVNKPGNAFEIFKQYVYDYLKEGYQFEEGENSELEVALKNAENFDDIEEAINDYWGWEDEQTVWMLASFIENVYIKGKTKYQYD
jgi:hypothetical protein